MKAQQVSQENQRKNALQAAQALGSQDSKPEMQQISPFESNDPSRTLNNKTEKHRSDLDNQASDSKQSKMFVWGDNKHGQLSLAPTCTAAAQVQDPMAVRFTCFQQIKSVACGRAHSLIVSDQGLVFAMGDNSFGQLGIPSSVSTNRNEQVHLVNELAPSQQRSVSQVYCSANSSFATMKAINEQLDDELYSWGSTNSGILGLGQPKSDIENRPSRIEFAEKSTEKPFKVGQMSVGEDHVAIIVPLQGLFCWGANGSGQLGLSDTTDRSKPTLNSFAQTQETVLVSCGNSFTFLISEVNEIMIAGKLPFTVQTEQGHDQDFIDSFQSIAQFDQRVKILQVEASRFASIIVDPLESGQPKELFLWGQSPLGVFNELTPLNQLLAGGYEQSENSQSFNVKAVKNGLNFCVFVDEQSGMTYQVGAENMIDPYLDDALVSLSELRDAQFADCQKFACGDNFVIGESTFAGSTLKSSPMKKVNQDVRQASPLKQQQTVISPQKKKEDEQNAYQIVSPDCSKQSFPQHALFQGSISPSTPSDSLCNMSGTKNVQFQHRELVGALRHIEGCQPIVLAQTPKRTGQHERINSCQEINRVQTKDAAKIDQVQREKKFNQTGKLDGRNHELVKPRITEETDEQSEDPTSEKMTDQNMLLTGNEPSTTTPQEQISVNEEVFNTQNKKEKNHNYSPDVSPIDGQLQETLRDSRIEHNWMDGTCSYPNMSAEKDESAKKRMIAVERDSYQRGQGKHLIMAQQMPLQTQHSTHMVFPSYSSNQRQPILMTQEALHVNGNLSSARFLPVQQSSLQNTPQKLAQQLAFQQVHPQMSMAGVGPSPVMMQSLNQSNLNASGFLNMSMQQHAMDQQSFYELLMKEKLETATLNGQLTELQRQLEKSRKDYTKLLAQVDEDSEEHAALRSKARRQEVDLNEIQLKVKDQEQLTSKMLAEKNSLERELKQTASAYTQLQAELTEAQQQVKKFVGLSKQCSSETCRKAKTDTDAQLEKKSKEIYDLTVKLGCLETENHELKVTVEERKAFYENRLDSSKIIVEQELQDAYDQVKRLSDALAEAHAEIENLAQNKTLVAKVSEKSVQTESSVPKNKFVQTAAHEEANKGVQVELDSDLQQSVTEDAQYVALPVAVYEALGDIQTKQVEEQSFAMSVSLNQQEQQDSSLGPEESLGGEQYSLKEFRFIEKSAQFAHQRQSMELPRQASGNLMAQRASMTRRNFMTNHTSEQDTSGKPKHNFTGNRGNAGNEPRIMGKSGRKSARGFGEGNDFEFGDNVSASKTSRLSGAIKGRFDQNRSTNYVAGYPDLGAKSIMAKDSSMINLNEPSNDAEASWQTFKPMTTCPNDRYSLARHQELFAESQISQKDSDGDANSCFDKVPASDRKVPGSRRAKSNSEVGALQLNSHKIRRLRHQRQKIARQDGAETVQSFIDDKSDNSVGAKSNMTTPVRNQMSQQPIVGQLSIQGQNENDDKEDKRYDQKSRNDSNLKYPTKIEKSPSLRATLNAIDSKAAAAAPFRQSQQLDKIPASTRNSKTERMGQSFQPCQTPVIKGSNDRNKNIFAQKRNSANVTARPRNSHNNCMTSRPSYLQNTTMTRSSVGVTQQHLGQSQSQSNIQRSVTPRVKSQQTLAGAPRPSTTAQGRTSKQSAGVNSAQETARARRVAYDHRRKLAFSSMKTMTQSARNFATASNINRQAREAVANANDARQQSQLTSCQQQRAMNGDLAQVQHKKNSQNAQESGYLSMQEEPFKNPPQQTKMPEMSVQEDSELPTLMSARNTGRQTANLSIISGIESERPFQQTNTQNNQPRYENEHTMQMQQNPFLATPVSGVDSSKDDQSATTYRQSESTREFNKKLFNPVHQQMSGSVTQRHDHEEVNPDESSTHLDGMKQKLHQIQSNKMLLERKIKEYENKLKQISQEPETQQVWAQARSFANTSQSHSMVNENAFENQTGSELTLGEPSQNKFRQNTSSDRHTPKHIFNTQERKKRAAFQQLTSSVNNTQSVSNLVLGNGGTKTTSTGFRDCFKAPPELPQSRMKAPPSIKTHYTSQAIFRR